MNILQIAAVLLVLTLVVVVPVLMVSAYRKFRGKRIVTCPETGQPAAVEVDARRAAVTAVLGEPVLRVKSCARWPEKRDCGQECLDQIEAAPEELLAQWSVGKTCARCGRPLGTISGREHYPALMDSSGRTFEWEAFPTKKLPEVLATHRPVCWYCHRRGAAPPSLPVAGPVATPGQPVL